MAFYKVREIEEARPGECIAILKKDGISASIKKMQRDDGSIWFEVNMESYRKRYSRSCDEEVKPRKLRKILNTYIEEVKEDMT